MPFEESIESLKGRSYRSWLIHRQRLMTRGLLTAGVFATLTIKIIDGITMHFAVCYTSALLFLLMLLLTVAGWTVQKPTLQRLIVSSYLTVLLVSLLSDAWSHPYWLAATSPVLLIVPIASAFVYYDAVDFAYATGAIIVCMVIVITRADAPWQVLVYLSSYMALTLAVSTMLQIIVSRQRRQYYDMERRLSHNAFVDELTGLWNRRYVLKMARKLCEHANTAISPMCILYIDADHFKQINDEHGHEMGDDILRALAARISACLRTGDVLGRIGGEEFVAVLPRTHAEDALSVARRICDEARSLTINGVTATVSIGIAPHITGADLRSTLNRADAAVLVAKRQGRNQIFLGKEGWPTNPSDAASDA